MEALKIGDAKHFYQEIRSAAKFVWIWTAVAITIML